MLLVFPLVSPKRKVGDSNSFWRAINNAESLYFQRFSAFYFLLWLTVCPASRLASAFASSAGAVPKAPLRAPFRALPFRLWGILFSSTISKYSAILCLQLFRFDLSFIFSIARCMAFFTRVQKETAKTNSVPYAIIRHTKKFSKEEARLRNFFVGSRAEKA